MKITSGNDAQRRCYDICIVGGGFSGTDLCIQLLRRAKRPLSIAVIDRGEDPGRGIAYSTASEELLLNVVAGKMSAIPEEPAHFASWLERVCGYEGGSDTFAPRRLYGKYLEDTLEDARKVSASGQLFWLRENAVSLQARGARSQLVLDSGPVIEARIIVLATGNAPPADPPPVRGIGRPFYAGFAWAKDALEGIASSGAVLLLGSGLTAVDQVIALRERGFCGTVTMLSRRGKLPAIHRPVGAWNVEWASAVPCTISALVAATRQQIRLASEQNIDWRAVIDSLRPHTSLLWQSWPLKERKRFLRHVRSFWEPARHRLSQKTHEMLMRLMDQRVLHVVAGRLLEAGEEDEQVVVTIRKRGQQESQRLVVDRIVNCTGPGTTDRVHDKLISSIVHAGLGRFDPLQIGIDVDERGSIVSSSGESSNCVYGIGPVRKASLWETTAVAEIREQAVHLADEILDQLTR